MSKRNIFYSCLLWLAMSGCSKEQEAPVDYTPIIAIYIGKTEVNSRYLQEVFTSPTTSHYEWVFDTITFNPDTMRVVQLSADSFELQTNSLLVQEWKHFAFRESEDPLILTYRRSTAFPGYFSHQLTLEFDLMQKTLKWTSEASQNTPASESKRVFFGEAQ